MLVPYVTFIDGFHFSRLDTIGWKALLIVGIVHTGITYCMYFSALKELPGQKVAILSYIDPLVAVMVSVIWLNEKMKKTIIEKELTVLGKKRTIYPPIMNMIIQN